MFNFIFDFFEKKAFGVCAWWGKNLGIEAHKVRLSFIYLSFITLGSNLIVYLIMVFILENKEYFKFSRKKPTIWEIEK